LKATDKASKLFHEEYKAKTTHFDRESIEGTKEEVAIALARAAGSMAVSLFLK
jgi:hypothetical protein